MSTEVESGCQKKTRAALRDSPSSLESTLETAPEQPEHVMTTSNLYSCCFGENPTSMSRAVNGDVSYIRYGIA